MCLTNLLKCLGRIQASQKSSGSYYLHIRFKQKTMCLAIPGQIQRIEDDELRTGAVSFAGVTKEVCLALVPEASVGDYVIVHVGFAISKMDEQAAQETLAMYGQSSDLSEDRKPDGFPPPRE